MKQLVGDHLFVENGNTHHEQTGAQYHTRSGHRGNCQRQLTTRPHATHLLIHHGPHGNNDNARCPGVGSGVSHQRDGNKGQHFRRQSPGFEHIKQLGAEQRFFEQHAHQNVKPDRQVQIGQVEYLGKVDGDSGKMPFRHKKVPGRREQHVAVDGNGEQRMQGFVFTFCKLLVWCEQMVQANDR